MEFFNECNPDQDESPTHDERPEDTPKQHFVLVSGRDFEVGENDEKNEEVVDAERFFDQISGKKLKRGFMPVPIVYTDVEQQGNPNPHSAPNERLLDADFVRLSVENDQIHKQHNEHEDVESNP